MDLEHFDNLTERLVEEIRAAINHYALYKAIQEQVKESPDVLNESVHFWSLTINAHLEATRTSLSRVYDREDKSLGLAKWLSLFESHFLKPEFFESNELDNYSRVPLKENDISDDLTLVSDSNPLVKTLYLRHRHTEIAHISLKNAQNQVSFFKKYPLTSDEIEELLTLAASIVNKYTVHHNGVYHSIVGWQQDDHKKLFDRLNR